STAIAASETYHNLPSDANNDYIANHIVIQGTGTQYTGITDLGERCFITGLSAGLMRDGGSGQVRIGSDSTDGCDDPSNARGNTIYNVQFQGGGNDMYCFRNTAYIQRSRFQDVAFMQAGGDLEACFYAANISGSIFEAVVSVSVSHKLHIVDSVTPGIGSIFASRSCSRANPDLP
ncbi:unnamed protein product, partial [marine sediment metagenome]